MAKSVSLKVHPFSLSLPPFLLPSPPIGAGRVALGNDLPAVFSNDIEALQVRREIHIMRRTRMSTGMRMSPHTRNTTAFGVFYDSNINAFFVCVL